MALVVKIGSDLKLVVKVVVVEAVVLTVVLAIVVEELPASTTSRNCTRCSPIRRLSW